MPYENVLLDISGGVAHLTLNRPDAANAMTLNLLRELAEALLECDESTDVRCVVLTGVTRHGLPCHGRPYRSCPNRLRRQQG